MKVIIVAKHVKRDRFVYAHAGIPCDKAYKQKCVTTFFRVKKIGERRLVTSKVVTHFCFQDSLTHGGLVAQAWSTWTEQPVMRDYRESCHVCTITAVTINM